MGDEVAMGTNSVPGRRQRVVRWKRPPVKSSNLYCSSCRSDAMNLLPIAILQEIDVDRLIDEAVQDGVRRGRRVSTSSQDRAGDCGSDGDGRKERKAASGGMLEEREESVKESAHLHESVIVESSII